MRNLPDADAGLRDVVPITSLLCSREEAGIDGWRTEKTRLRKGKKDLVYFVPGPPARGKRLHAMLAVRKGLKYYSVQLYGHDLDRPLPEVYAFKALLEKASLGLFGLDATQNGPFYRLFWELEGHLPSCSRILEFGFIWASFQAVTEEFVEKFMILVSMIYSRASQLYAEQHGTWTKEDWLNYMRRPDPAHPC
jgi:hypothetical protein